MPVPVTQPCLPTSCQYVLVGRKGRSFVNKLSAFNTEPVECIVLLSVAAELRKHFEEGRKEDIVMEGRKEDIVMEGRKEDMVMEGRDRVLT